MRHNPILPYSSLSDAIDKIKMGEDFQRMYLQLAILQLFNLRVAILSLGIVLNRNNSFRVCHLTGDATMRAISDDSSFRRHFLFVVVVLASIGVMRPLASQAQTCGTDYTIKEGETLAQIAARVYGNPAQWTIIFYANQDRLGTNVSLLVPDLRCGYPASAVGQQAQPLPPIATTPAQTQAPSEASIIISTLVRRIEFLTADGFAPFTGRSLEGGGMLTQVIACLRWGSSKDEAKGASTMACRESMTGRPTFNPLFADACVRRRLFPGRARIATASIFEPTSQFRWPALFSSPRPLYRK